MSDIRRTYSVALKESSIPRKYVSPTFIISPLNHLVQIEFVKNTNNNKNHNDWQEVNTDENDKKNI